MEEYHPEQRDCWLARDGERVIGALVERGEPVVTAEADATNVESNTLLTARGGRVTGGSVEFHRA